MPNPQTKEKSAWQFLKESFQPITARAEQEVFESPLGQMTPEQKAEHYKRVRENTGKYFNGK